MPMEDHKKRLLRLKEMKTPVPLYRRMEDKFVEEKILPEQEKIRNALIEKK